MTSLECFEKSSVILLLNKDDLLRQLLKQKDNGLAHCFSKNGVWPNEHEYWDTTIDDKYWPFIDNNEKFEEFHTIVTDFIKQLFLNANKHKQIASELDCLRASQQLQTSTDRPRINGAEMFDVANGDINKFHCHVTTATDYNIVASVFQNIQVALISDNMSVMGLGADATTAAITTAAITMSNGSNLEASEKMKNTRNIVKKSSPKRKKRNENNANMFEKELDMDVTVATATGSEQTGANEEHSIICATNDENRMQTDNVTSNDVDAVSVSLDQ